MDMTCVSHVATIYFFMFHCFYIQKKGSISMKFQHHRWKEREGEEKEYSELMRHLKCNQP